MESTWEARELPVLDAIVRHFDEANDGYRLYVPTFIEQNGLDAAQVTRAVHALSPTYIRLLQGQWGRGDVSVMSVTDAARRAVGQWPSPESVADRIVQGLLAAAEREPDQAKRTKLRAAAEAVGGFARDLVVNAIANVATKPIDF